MEHKDIKLNTLSLEKQAKLPMERKRSGYISSWALRRTNEMRDKAGQKTIRAKEITYEHKTVLVFGGLVVNMSRLHENQAEYLKDNPLQIKLKEGDIISNLDFVPFGLRKKTEEGATTLILATLLKDILAMLHMYENGQSPEPKLITGTTNARMASVAHKLGFEVTRLNREKISQRGLIKSFEGEFDVWSTPSRLFERKQEMEKILKRIEI